MVFDSSRFSQSMLTVGGHKIQFKTIRRPVLKTIHNALSEVNRSSPGFKIRFGLSLFNGGNTSGVFTEYGLVGIMEDVDFNSVDMV